jgi:uncharacterized SAM-binding protein YcdF (DUF218 family)
MRTWAFLLALFSGVVIASAAFLWIAAGEIYDYEDTFHLPQDAANIEVVLCLAGGKKRIPLAIDIWMKLKKMDSNQKTSPILFLSGVGPKLGLEALKEQGIPKEVLADMKSDEVVFENVSENTFENAQIFASFVKQKKWRHVLLVTAGYHMRRAQFILKKALEPDVEIKTMTVDAVHFDRNQWHNDPYAVRVTLMEYIKWLYYRYTY